MPTNSSRYTSLRSARATRIRTGAGRRKGETLRSILNQAWTFSVIAQIAFFAAIGLLLAAVVALGALFFEVIEALRGKESVEAVTPKTDPTRGELAQVN
jgi:hypothetical protein